MYGILYMIVSIRYRSMIPMFYLLMLMVYLTRAIYMPLLKPLLTVGEVPSAVVNIPFIIVSVIMLFLSIQLLSPFGNTKFTLFLCDARETVP